MKNKLSILCTICSLLLLAGCSDSGLNSETDDFQALGADEILKPENGAEFRAPAPGDQTIAEIVVNSANADDEQFTLLLAALEFTGLTDVFAGTDQFTVFAPTDEAFVNLVNALADDLDQDVLNNEGPFAAIDDLLGDGTVANVLLYHVTEGRRASNSVVPKNPRAKERKITTLLDGATFTVSNAAEITAIGNTSNIIDTDISASNGIIHVIDTVILPVNL